MHHRPLCGTHEELVEHRREHQPENGPAFLNQRHVHGEVAVAGDELLRAIQRIDQPESAVRLAVDLRSLVLLADHGHAGQHPLQTGDQTAVRGKIRLRQRRAVGLGVHARRSGTVIDGHHRPTRLPRQFDQTIQKIRMRTRVSHSAYLHHPFLFW
jgi:hypothetical protein